MYFQAVPLFMRDDANVFGYFRDYRDEIDAATGEAIVIVLPRVVAAGNAKAFDSLFRKPVRDQRYPGLKRLDLPCLWIEDGDQNHILVKLPDSIEETKKVIRALADGAPQATSAENLRRLLEKTVPEVSKKSQQFAAFTFGVAFVIAMLVLAIAFPNPTPFQYTVFRIVLAIAIAGVAAMIPGFISVELSAWLRAGGALAVFVVVFFKNPAGLVADAQQPKLVNGFVRDSLSYRPIRQAAISMSGLSTKAESVSQDSGYFAFPGRELAPGRSVDLTAHKAGYADFSDTFTVGDKPVDLYMKAATIAVKAAKPQLMGIVASARHTPGWPKPVLIDAAGPSLDRSLSKSVRIDPRLGIANADPTCRENFRASYSVNAPATGLYNMEIEYASGEDRDLDLIVNGAQAKTGILKAPTAIGEEGFTTFAPFGTSGIRLHDGENSIEFVRQGNSEMYPGNCTPFLRQFVLVLDQKDK
jgi:hypothetical protein